MDGRTCVGARDACASKNNIEVSLTMIISDKTNADKTYITDKTNADTKKCRQNKCRKGSQQKVSSGTEIITYWHLNIFPPIRKLLSVRN